MVKQTINIFTLVMLLCTSSLYAASDTQHRIKIGSGMLTYSWLRIKVYQLDYFKGHHSEEEWLELSYKTKVKREYSERGMRETLEYMIKRDPTLKPPLDWICAQLVDVKKGDVLTLYKNKNLVRISKNGKILGETKQQKVAQLIFSPWIGEHPVNKSLKYQLLGKQKERS